MRANQKRRDGISPLKRDEVYGRGTRLRGVDLVEQIAANTAIQKQRWIDLYYRLWERKAKVDIAETIVVVDGTPRDWFYTSAATGEIQRKSDASHLTAIAIKKHFVRKSDPAALARHIALLVHEDAVGDMAYAVLNELDFNLALCQAASPLWAASFVLQPCLSAARQHPQYSGTFVAKFNASTTSSVRVLHTDQSFHDMKRAGEQSSSCPSISSGTRRSRPLSAPSQRVKPVTVKTPRGVEELVRTEMAKLVGEIEAATQDTLRQLQAEFQITRTHRLVLVRVARVVFASDFTRVRGLRGHSPPRNRPSSAGSTAASRRCAGARFCHCKAFATGEITKTSTALATSNDLQQITRKSLQLCDEESAFLDTFGANAEAHLESLQTTADAYETFKRVLQRRMFMLRSTLWNPDSDSFSAKPLAWEDERSKQPQQYEMVRVCRTCYLIYHAMDAERFQATKSTVKAAARRLSMLHNAKLLSERATARPRTAPSRRQQQQSQRAWEEEAEKEEEERGD